MSSHKCYPCLTHKHLARARNLETGVWTGKKIGILRAAATRENDMEPTLYYAGLDNVDVYTKVICSNNSLPSLHGEE